MHPLVTYNNCFKLPKPFGTDCPLLDYFYRTELLLLSNASFDQALFIKQDSNSVINPTATTAQMLNQ